MTFYPVFKLTVRFLLSICQNCQRVAALLTIIIILVQLMYNWRYDQESMVSYLPLSHVAGMFIDIFLSIYGGATVHFADKLALQVSIISFLVAKLLYNLLCLYVHHSITLWEKCRQTVKFPLQIPMTNVHPVEVYTLFNPSDCWPCFKRRTKDI